MFGLMFAISRTVWIAIAGGSAIAGGAAGALIGRKAKMNPSDKPVTVIVTETKKSEAAQ